MTRPPAPPRRLDWLLGLVRPYCWALTAAGVLLLAQSGTTLVLPWLAGQVAVTLLTPGVASSGSLNLLFTAVIGLFALQGILTVGHRALMTRTDERITADLRAQLYDHLQRLPLGFHHDRGSGSLLGLLTRDVDTVSGFFSGGLVTTIPLMMTLVGALGMMLRIDWVLGSLVALGAPLLLVVVRLVGRRLRPLADQVADAHAEALAVAAEQIGALPIIKAFAREGAAACRYRVQVDRLRRLSVRYALLQGSLRPLMELVAVLGLIALMWLASRRLVDGRMSPDALVSFFGYGLVLRGPASALATLYGLLQVLSSASTRLQATLSLAPEPSGQGSRVLGRARGDLEFRSVCFAYPGAGPLLEGLSFRVHPGETVAITGDNGAGKSTLVSLLLRFLEPRSGQILLDGVDVASVDLGSLRRQIGLVPQAPMLLGATVRDCIAYGVQTAGRAQVEAAARAAMAHDFILTLPGGYDSRVGERGVRLSGGQQQRIALARALLLAAPILVLDEATAMLEPRAEARLFESSSPLLAGRTVLVISHSEQVGRVADRTLHLENGRIEAASGSRANDQAGAGAP